MLWFIARPLFQAKRIWNKSKLHLLQNTDTIYLLILWLICCTETVKKLLYNSYINSHTPQRHSRCPDSCIKKKKRRKISLNNWRSYCWSFSLLQIPIARSLSFSKTNYIKQMADGLQILQHYRATAEPNRKTKYKATFHILNIFLGHSRFFLTWWLFVSGVLQCTLDPAFDNSDIIWQKYLRLC